MEENMYQMVVTDLDGTLLNSKNQISDRNETALETFRERVLWWQLPQGVWMS